MGEKDRRGSVLFVDDEKSILASIKRLFFREREIEVITAESGKEGLKLLDGQDIDLVVADHRMPQMTGAEFLRLVKERNPEVLRIMLTGYADIKTITKSVNEGEVYRFLTKPWNDEDLKITIKKALEYCRLEKANRAMSDRISEQNKELKDLNAGLEKKVRQRTGQLEKAVGQLKQMSETQKRNFQSTLILLTQIMGYTSRFLAGHSKRVAELAKTVATKMKCDQDKKEMIYFAALLHDIGLIGAPDTLFSEDIDQFSKQERKIFFRHTLIGEEIIGNLHNLKRLSVIIRSHHEAYLGDGFPDGLQKDKIPFGARLIRIVSDYDRLRFRKGVKEEQARALLKEGSGYLYDPQIVRVLCDLTESISEKQTFTKRVLINDLQPGMVLNGDIELQNGLLLLPRGSVLDASTVRRISAFSSALDAGTSIEVFV